MSTLQQISRQRSRDLEAEQQRVLDEVKEPLREAAEFTRREIPKIEAALAEAAFYRRDNVDCLDWKALGGMPKTIADSLFEIENLQKTPDVLREMLRRYDALTWKDAWGKRKDGERDRNTAASLRGSFNFLLARGCARAIEEGLTKLRSALTHFEERITEKSGGDDPLLGAPAERAEPLKVLTNVDHDA